MDARWKEEDQYLEEQIQAAFKEFLNKPSSLSVGICSKEGEVIRTPMEGYLPRKYARFLAPFSKRCATVVQSLDPRCKPLGFSIWTIKRNYSVVLGDDFLTYCVQTPIPLPTIPPKPMEEVSETERNEKKDREIKHMRKVKKEKQKIKDEEAKKAKELLDKQKQEAQTQHDKRKKKKKKKKKKEEKDDESTESDDEEKQKE